MSTSSKRWIIRPQAAPAQLRRFGTFSPVMAQILLNRGWADPVEAEAFLAIRTTRYKPLEPGFEMKDVRRAAQRLLRAIRDRESIVVYGDFDADGVTSTVLMVEVLQALKADVRPYIPNRIDEGYGLNSEALSRLADDGAKVVITVDCGIRSVEEVETGKAAGLDIIVTDHHSIGPHIPEAYAVVNPKQQDCPYPEKMLAGVGVAYKVAGALLQEFAGQSFDASEHVRQWVSRILEDVRDLVAIGTVADLAPLNCLENRALVRLGLDVLNRASRPGVKALLEVSGIEPGRATAMSIGYALGPRINAAGRLSDAMIAYDLLAARTIEEARDKALELQHLNIQRQELTREAQDAIRAQVLAAPHDDTPLIFAGGDFQPGIVGLVAGRLVEEFYRPSVVMEYGESESRASCRSIPDFDITSALDECADLLVRHGGHAQAAGFTVLNENLEVLKALLSDKARAILDGQELRPTLEIDAEVDVNQLSEELWEQMQHLEPTGHMNNPPVLVSKNLYALECRQLKDGRHLKLKIARAGRPPLDAIGFGLGDWASRLSNNAHFDLAYQLEMNEWNGSRNLQLNIQDIRLAGEG
jgi:single-stranded-DNA-specific exonuclease